jgi:hypothetical protein
MSAVIFESAHGEALLRGAERAYLGNVCSNAATAFTFATLGEDRVAELLDIPRSVEGRWRFPLEDQVRATLAGIMDRTFEYHGDTINAWEFGLNTALAGGGDFLRLAARMHAQCEIHAWIAAEDCLWFADMIQRERDTGTLRADVGWEAVIQLLIRNTRQTRPDPFPVVMSYTVTGRWLDRLTAGMGEDAFAALDTQQQWEWCVPHLKESMRIQPEDWHRYRFGDCLTAFDIAAEAWPPGRVGRAADMTVVND